MNDFQNSLLETMQMFSSNAAFNAKTSPVINGEIIEVIDAGLKTYKVKYQENEFSAISAGGMKYSIGEIVYILVPDGDFSKDKFILGSLNPSASSLIQSGDSLKYYDISENLFNINEFYEFYELNSHKTELYTVELNKAQSEVLSEYLKTYRKLAFGYKVKTELAETQVGGNYGMRINIPVLDKEKNTSIKTFTLDIDQLLGTPYSMGEWSPQSIFFTLEDKYIIDTEKNITIDSFCSDFPQNKSINIKDIFFKDVFFKVVEEYTEEDNIGYKLTITSDSGNYFLKNGSAKKKLSSTLKVNGDITSFKGRPCYWLIEDSSVKPGHEQYLNHAGRGWRLLQQNAEVLEIDASLVLSDAQFRCIVLYDDYVISDTIYIKNLNTGIEIDVFPTKGSTTFMKDVGEVELTAQYYEDDFTDTIAIVCIWERYDRNHTLISTTETYSSMKTIDGKDWIVSNLKFPTNEVEGFNTVKCSITKNGALVGSRELSISTTENWEYRLVIENGNKIYKYDSDGDSPMEANYDGPVSSALTSLTPLNCRIFKVDGTELTENEYEQCWYEWRVPVNSMFELEDELKEVLSEDKEYYIIQGRKCTTLPYQIAKRFDKSKAENNIQLRVDFLGKILDNIINISFLKEGANGTNGTKYTAVPVMVENNGNSYPFGARGGEFGYVQKMHIIYNTELKTWYWHDTRDNSLQSFASRLPIGVLVYEDGELLKFDPDPKKSDYKVSYKIFDENSTNPCFTVSTTEKGFANFTIKKTNNVEIVPKLTDTFCNIIQAEITITRSGNESAAAATTVLYAYYPIELTITNIASYNNMTVLPTLNGGFSEVLYTTDGTNPQYDSTYPFSCSESILENEIKEYYSITWEAQHHLHEYNVDEVEKAHGTLRYKPSQKYDDGNSKNYVKAILAFDASLKANLTKQIDDNTTQITTLENAIQNIDDIRNSVVNAETIYLESKFEDRVNKVSFLLDTREKAYKQTFIIDEYLRVLEEYLETYHSEVRSNCKELDKELNELQRQIDLAKKSLIDFNGYDFIVDLGKYVIDFEPLKNNYCLYELNRGVATTIDAYILDINQAILVYKQLHTDIEPLFKNLIEYKNISNQLARVRDAIRDEVSIKSSIAACVIDIPNIFNKKELLDNIQDVYYKQIKPYLATDMTSKQISTWQEEIGNLRFDIYKMQQILATEGKVMSHIRPIVLTFNRYEMSNINGWDGNKLDTGLNDEYLLAPQVGAGIKDAENTFTGVVMGMRNIYGNVNKDKVDIGLFGYSKGRQSYFLNAKEGTATFGIPGKGQIIIDPDNSDGDAVIYGGDFISGSSGMKINLTEPSITWGNNNFKVNSDGHITAKGGGSIAGWNINDTTLKSKNNTLTFDSANEKIFSSNHDSLNSRADGFYLSHDGLSIGSGIEISSAGVVKVGQVKSENYWTISGDNKNTYSYIGYKTNAFSSSNLGDIAKYSIDGSSEQVYLGTDGIRLGNKFAVDNNGNLVAKHLITTGGIVGGWTIDSSTLSAKNITLNSNGSMSGKVTSDGDSAWEISTNGTATFDKLIANNKGSIGGWEIDTDTLKGGGITLNKKGSITGTNGTDSWEINGDGSVEFNKGFIGGWTIANGKISGGDTSEGYAAAVQAPSESINWVFAAGGYSHDSYSGAPFRVHKNGNVYCENLYANKGGEIAGWSIGEKTLIKKVDSKFKIRIAAPSDKGGFGNGNADVLVVEDLEELETSEFRYPIVISSNGTLRALTADIRGKITATTGEFSNCTINNSCTINCAINGSLITKGTISAKVLDIDGIFAKEITATGTISGATLDGSKITGGTIKIGDEDEAFNVNSAGGVWIGGSGVNDAAFGVTHNGTVYFGSASYPDRNIYVYGNGGNIDSEPYKGVHKGATFSMQVMRDLKDAITLYFIKGICVGFRNT